MIWSGMFVCISDCTTYCSFSLMLLHGLCEIALSGYISEVVIYISLRHPKFDHKYLFYFSVSKSAVICFSLWHNDTIPSGVILINEIIYA